jgi:signal transduction histidine kinase
MTFTGPVSEVPAADRLDARVGATASAETCELLNAMTGSASACLLAPPDWSVLCSAPPAASVPRSLYEKLCPPPWEEPCLFDLRELEPALLTGSDVPAWLAALAVVPLGDENGLWGAAVLCWAAAPSRLITPQWLAALGPLVSAARARARLAGALQRVEARWRAVYEMSAALSHTPDRGSLLNEIVRRSTELLGTHGGGLTLRDETSDEAVITVIQGGHLPVADMVGRRLKLGEGISGRAILGQRPVILDSYATWSQSIPGLAERIQDAALSVPLISDGRAIGALTISDNTPGRRFTEEDVQTLSLFAQQAALVLEGARRREQEGVIALNAERARLAYDLHDGLAQDLAALLLRADACQALLGEGNEALRGQLEIISVGLQRAIRDARATIFALRSGDLEGCSLEDGLRAEAVRFEGQTRVPVAFSMSGADCQGLSHEHELALLSAAQEALTNIHKHAQARRVQVQLTWLGTEQVQLCISDDGKGFDPSSSAGAPGVAGHHLGLGMMRERVEALGGRVSVDTEIGRGTAVRIELPMANGAGGIGHAYA